MWILIVLGIIAFLVMEHNFVFWVLFVPLGVLFLITIVGFFKNRRAGVSDLVSIVFVFLTIIVALVLVAS